MAPAKKKTKVAKKAVIPAKKAKAAQKPKTKKISAPAKKAKAVAKPKATAKPKAVAKAKAAAKTKATAKTKTVAKTKTTAKTKTVAKTKPKTKSVAKKEVKVKRNTTSQKKPAALLKKKISTIKGQISSVTANKKADTSDRFRGLKSMLMAKRDGILKEAKQEIAKYISGENRQLVDTAIDEADWAAVDISEDISLKRLGAHRQLLLDIEESMRKINEGTYGICEDCGEEISEKRLNVIPTATLCIDCKEQREKMAAFELETEI